MSKLVNASSNAAPNHEKSGSAQIDSDAGSGNETKNRSNRKLAGVVTRLGFAAVVTLLCLGNSGCQVYLNARRTLFQEPSEYCWKADRKRSIKTYQVWADGAWCKVCREGNVCRTVDYEAGFKDGFVDLVYAGGDGTPPPVPPRRFWNLAERNDPGHEAAAQWFAGFRHGAQIAKQEGYRERAVLQVSGFHCSEPAGCPESDTRYFLPGGKGASPLEPGDKSEPEPGILQQREPEVVVPLPADEAPMLGPAHRPLEENSILPEVEDPMPQPMRELPQSQPKLEPTPKVEPAPKEEPAPKQESTDDLEDLFGRLQQEFQVAPAAAVESTSEQVSSKALFIQQLSGRSATDPSGHSATDKLQPNAAKPIPTRGSPPIVDHLYQVYP